MTLLNSSTITKDGKKIIMDRTYNNTPTYSAPSQFGVGINQENISIDDTDLTLPVPIQNTETVDDCESTTGWTTDASNTISTTTTHYKEGSNAITVDKADTTNNYVQLYKTVTSLDFTNKRINIWVYIANLTLLVSSGTAINIRYGSDSSNYYQKDIDITDLSIGWNYLVFTKSTADSTVGTPVDTACDYFFLQFNTPATSTTFSSDNIIIDDINLASTDDFYENFVSGYPSVDEMNFNVTTRCYLNSLQANGFDISGLKIANTDSTPMIFSVSKYSPESKGPTDEFSLVVTDEYL